MGVSAIESLVNEDRSEGFIRCVNFRVLGKCEVVAIRVAHECPVAGAIAGILCVSLLPVFENVGGIVFFSEEVACVFDVS
jgi:hypothetical protein